MIWWPARSRQSRTSLGQGGVYIFWRLNSVGGTAVDRLLPSTLTSRPHFETAGVASLVLASPPTLADTTADTAQANTANVWLPVDGRQHALDLDPRTLAHRCAGNQ
jgi:hypothetical protein